MQLSAETCPISVAQNTGPQLLGPLAPNSTALVSLVAIASADVPLGITEAFPVNITAGDATLDVPFSLFIGNSSVNASLSVLTVDQCVSLLSRSSFGR